MQSLLRPFVLASATLISFTSGFAQTISLVPLSPVDTTALGIDGWGGASIDPVTGHLWVSDGGVTTNDVFEIDPNTGQIFSSFDATAVPGMTKGPDGLALQPGTGNIFLFSPFAENDGGIVTQTGALVSAFPTAHGAAAAAFRSNGELWVYNDTSRQLERIDPVTWSTLATMPIQGVSGRIPSMEFHPVTGNLFAFLDETFTLLEISMASGQVLATANMAAFGINGFFGTAMAFDATGQKLYIGRGFGPDADILHVFSLGAAPISYCAGDGTATACPCGNVGAAGAGCANSSGNGATLVAAGSTSVGSDDMTFQVVNGTANLPGIVFAGTQSVNGGAGTVFGDGLLCAGGMITRLGVKFLDGSGSATWGPTLSPVGGWGVGDTRYFQAWFRDVTGPCSVQFNTSQALEIHFIL